MFECSHGWKDLQSYEHTNFWDRNQACVSKCVIIWYRGASCVG